MNLISRGLLMIFMEEAVALGGLVDYEQKFNPTPPPILLASWWGQETRILLLIIIYFVTIIRLQYGTV